MEVVGLFLLVAGTGFVFIAGLGMLRLPDVFMRMHASTKAGTLGVTLISVSAIFFFGSLDVLARATALIFFVLLTAPVAAHMIGRAAYRARAEMWQGTFVDEKKEHLERASGSSSPSTGERSQIPDTN